MARLVWQSDADAVVRTARLDPRFAYLRVQGPQGPAALLVLGYEDRDASGVVQTWYSASQETLQLAQGRLHMTHGLAVNRLHTAWPQGLPTWPSPGARSARASGEPAAHEQIIDLGDPGPRGLKLAARVQEVPASEVPGSVFGRLRDTSATPVSAQEKEPALRWFKEEAYLQGTAAPNQGTALAQWATGLPARSAGLYFTQWFAVRGTELVFSHQCVRPDFCLSLQPWPVPAQAQAKR